MLCGGPDRLSSELTLDAPVYEHLHQGLIVAPEHFVGRNPDLPFIGQRGASHRWAAAHVTPV